MARKLVLFAVFFLFLGLVSVQLIMVRSVAPLDGRQPLPGLSGEVEVYRDKFGIPHIFAPTRKDAFRALGYIMASERLFQMDVYRRVGAGRLSEIFGEKTLEFDILLRNFRLKSYMTEIFGEQKQKFPAEMVEEGEAFYQGINQYLGDRPLPYEFKLLGYQPGPFSFEDSLGFIGYMAYSFSSSLKTDLLMSKLRTELEDQLLQQLRLEPGLQGPHFTQAAAEKYDFDLSMIARVFAMTLDGFSAFEGSNSWVLSPHRSHTGKAILANDPHIGFSLPNIWFEAHIHTPDYEIYGHFLPGIPFPILGHTRKYGWAFTMSEIDDMDFYQEELDETGTRIKYKGEWVGLRQTEEVIKVKGGPDHVVNIGIGPHGPLIDSLLAGQKKDSPKHVAVKWAFHLPENNVMEAIYRMGRAESMNDFRNSLALATAPGLNVSYADTEGNIGWWVFGKIPRRKNSSLNDFILDGASGEDEYIGYLPFEENPHAVNPESGVIVTANARPDGAEEYVKGNWEPSDRYETIVEQLSAKEKWSVEEMKALQIGNINLHIKGIKAILLTAIGQHLMESKDSIEKELFNRLSAWDGQSGVDSVEATVYHSWNRRIQEAVLARLRPEDGQLYCSVPPRWTFYKRLLKDARSGWWDNPKTLEVESREVVILDSWKTTLERLRKEYGNDITKWNWGRAHTVTYVHALGKNPILAPLFNLGPFPAPGGYNQINNFRAVGCDDHFQVKAGPSTRRVVDFSYPEVSWGGLPIGISGHKKSPFYGKEAASFLAGEHRHQLMDLQMIKSQAGHRLVLFPQKK